MPFITDKGCCNMELQQACRVIGSVLLALITISLIIHPEYLSEPSHLSSYILQFAANISLCIGAQLKNQCLVLIWLIYSVLVIVGSSIMCFYALLSAESARSAAVLYNTDHSVSDEEIESLVSTGIYILVGVLILITVLYIYLFRIVLSFWHQLRNGLPTNAAAGNYRSPYNDASKV